MENAYFKYGLLIIVTLFVAWFVSMLLRKILGFFIKRNSKELFVDPTNFIFLKNSISFFCFSIALFWVFTKIPYLHSLGNALFASAGVLAAVIGFASQKAFANIIGGIFILIFKPFRVGDSIEIASGKKGIVEEITLRHTVIKDYEFRRIIVPNSFMSEDTIINNSITDEKVRRQINIDISYDSNLELAESILRSEVEKHPFFIDNRTDDEISKEEPAVPVKVVSLGDSGITIRAFVWAQDFESAIDLERDILRSTKLAFDDKGVEIPFPHRTLVFKNSVKIDQNETKQ